MCKSYKQGTISASMVISENLPRRAGLAADAGPGKGFEWRGIPANIVISENLPRRTGLSADAGPRSSFECTPGGRGWEAEAGELGTRRQERSACLTTGLPGYGQGCSPRIVRFEHKSCPKKVPFWVKFSRGFRFLVPGERFWRVLVSSWRSPACFL